MSGSDETDRLGVVAGRAQYAEPVNAAMINHTFDILCRFLRPGSILEIGPAEGTMTEKLVELRRDLSLIEGAAKFCGELKRRYPHAAVHNSLVEEFKSDRKYPNIVLGHVLEHVLDPAAILRRVSNWLADDGIIFCAVPNARSLHRQAAVLMKLTAKEDELSELDHIQGHRRVYTPETFRQDFNQASLDIVHFGGFWLKPVTNKQISDTWSAPLLNAYMKLGERYPDIAAELYVVAKQMK